MALPAELESLLELIQDPAEREARRKLLTELHEGGLRQSDYSRKMNELSEQRKAWEEEKNRYLEWYKSANDEYTRATSELKAAKERLAALEAAGASAKAAAEAHGGTASDYLGDDYDKALQEARREAQAANKRLQELQGVVDNINKMLSTGQLITADKFEQEFARRGDAFGAVLLDIIDYQEKHRREFGTDLDRRVLIEEARNRGGNLAEAYKAITEKAREEKLRKQIESEVEAKFKEQLKKSNVPYAESGEPILGPLQARLQKKDSAIPEDITADGSGRLASLIAEELRKEGKV
jgi:multidrug efflux pump subunit AcrA (membrane-fusion protein)